MELTKGAESVAVRYTVELVAPGISYGTIINSTGTQEVPGGTESRRKSVPSQTCGLNVSFILNNTCIL